MLFILSRIQRYNIYRNPLKKQQPENACKVKRICTKTEVEKIAFEVLVRVTVSSIEHVKKRNALECSSLFALHEHTKFALINWWENYEILNIQMALGRKTEQKQGQKVALFMWLAARRHSLETRAEVLIVHRSCKHLFCYVTASFFIAN